MIHDVTFTHEEVKRIASKAITTILALALLSNLGAAGVNPTQQNINTFLENYNISGQNNTLELASTIGQNASEQGLNCDVRECVFQNHTKEYINVFYPEVKNSKGYLAYYTWFGPQKKTVTGLDKGVFQYKNFEDNKTSACQIRGLKSCKIVKSYLGNVSAPNDNNTTDISVNLTHITNTVDNCTKNISENVTHYVNNTSLPSEINVYVKNATSNDSAKLDIKINEQPTKKTIGYYTEAFKNMLLGIFN